MSGRVVGADGTGLPGVTVLVRASSIGTTTGADGSFSLNAPRAAPFLSATLALLPSRLP
ncbi:carboxypeptidase-like regulatory domain-containing protein [Hymenobacter sp. BRD67]|uniref:carboxypeptidase-like regulatory domain-containing protein n=1 Tax=Hymenobacter sp. BRD67 TaxID=2675877 RepID=UPI001566FEB2|nr:carboxypeptidase-like regulatory domain-containing protein [Hymenobacter sp. BRD67]QKG51868.1 carboxypeptidase-like regulatory domain-containing protein [Hymenobacter sp. BRD67]